VTSTGSEQLGGELGGTSADAGAAAAVGTVGIVGAGLIGASIGMALTAAGVDVLLRDSDPEQALLAAARRAGRVWPEGERVSHAVIAVPPHAVAGVLRDLQKSEAADTASDVASVKAQVVAEALALGCDLSTFCPAHPIAGRERAGAMSAQGDLFRDRTWALCPLPGTQPTAVAAATAIAGLCGAFVVTLEAVRHDELMAGLSHLPQVVASALAAEAAGGLHDGELALAGSGLRDTTRLADSDASLWASILEGNRTPVADRIDRLVASLAALSRTLRAGSADDVSVAVSALLGAGAQGRRRIPAKVGQPTPDWSWVGVVVPDQQGELTRLFVAVGAWGINVEDVRVEHSHEEQRGEVELAVRQPIAESLTSLLREAGWRAYQRE
jgi:prephenate dehydrogenase